MSGTMDPGADPRLRFDEPVRCVCGGLGAVTDAADAGDGWWLATWQTQHRPGCEGLAAPERAYLVDAEAMARGDYLLPGVAAEEEAPPVPPGHLPRCRATASTTGQQCRNRAGPGGLCPPHRRRP